MSVSPADFELYSRATGAPLPRTPEERMKMAPEVHNFVRSQGYAKKPDFWRGTIRPLLQNAAIGYGIASAGKSFVDNASFSTPDSAPVREPVDVSWYPQDGSAQLPPGVKGGAIVPISQNPSPQMPSPGDNVGSVGTITKDLNTGAVPTSTFNVSGQGFINNDSLNSVLSLLDLTGGEIADKVRRTVEVYNTNQLNKQGIFINSAPHSVTGDNPFQVDLDMIFRSLKITILDNVPIYP